jgi:hypothetical protein
MIKESWKQKRDTIIKRLHAEGKCVPEIAGRLRLTESVVRTVLRPMPAPKPPADPAPTSPYFDKNCLTDLGRTEMLRRFDDGEDLVTLAHDFGYLNARAVRSAIYQFRRQFQVSDEIDGDDEESGFDAMDIAWPAGRCFEDDPRALREVGGAMPPRPESRTVGGVARYG